jgi:hypothetical protein
MSCTKCLSSLHVAYVTHGINTRLLEESLTEVIKCYQEHYPENSQDFTVMEKVHYQSKVANLNLLLSLLQRSKAFG